MPFGEWAEMKNSTHFLPFFFSLTTLFYEIEFKITGYQFVMTNKYNLQKPEVKNLAQEYYVSPGMIFSDV